MSLAKLKAGRYGYNDGVKCSSSEPSCMLRSAQLCAHMVAVGRSLLKAAEAAEAKAATCVADVHSLMLATYNTADKPSLSMYSSL